MARPSGIQFLNLRLVDNTDMSDGSRKLIVTEMLRLFRGVTRQWLEIFPSSQFLMVQPTFHPGDLKDTDLRCFILRNQERSVVRRLRGNGISLGAAGPTRRRTWGGFEVYDSAFGADYVTECAVIFHELMHNKLQMGNEMHTDGDVGFGIASAEVEDARGLGRRSLGINGTNERAMAKVLLKPVRLYWGWSDRIPLLYVLAYWLTDSTQLSGHSTVPCSLGSLLWPPNSV
jgi:hypothetical protein